MTPAATVEDTLSARLAAPTECQPLVLDGYDAGASPGIGGKKAAERAMEGELAERLGDLHDRLIAASDQSVLIVLQGLDASGKSGTIKHVGRILQAGGFSCASFTEPEGKEEDEHFLARIRRQLPEPGRITFFDRSHYEDALVPYAEGELDGDGFEDRLGEIRDFESELIGNGTMVVKCLLHLSYDEQRERFLRRLRRPDKQWKFSDSDLETREQWPRLQLAYAEVIGRTSTPEAPWHIVPADHKWYRNWAIATILAEHLQQLDPQYPALDTELDVDALRRRLEQPS